MAKGYNRYYYQEIELEGLGEHDFLYQAFANRLRKYPKGLSFKQIHFKIGTPLGLTKEDTREVLGKAVAAGYIEKR